MSFTSPIVSLNNGDFDISLIGDRDFPSFLLPPDFVGVVGIFPSRFMSKFMTKDSDDSEACCVKPLMFAELMEVLVTAVIRLPPPEVELESCNSLLEDMAIGL